MAAKKRSGGSYSEVLGARVDEATRGISASGGSGSTRWPATGTLERDVDAILMSRGLALNAPPEQLLDKSRRMQPFPASRAGRKRKSPRRRKAAKKSPPPRKAAKKTKVRRKASKKAARRSRPSRIKKRVKRLKPSRAKKLRSRKRK